MDSGETTVDEGEKSSGELEQGEEHGHADALRQGDPEAGGVSLEKKQTSGSSKGPNLINGASSPLLLSVISDSFSGHLGWSR